MCKVYNGSKPAPLSLLLIVLGCAAVVSAQKIDNSALAEIRALEDRRIEAMLKRDVKTLEEFFAAGMTYGHGNGLMETREHFLDRLRPTGDLIYTALDRKDVQIRVYKNTALITGTVAIKVRVNGQDREPGRASFLAVWIKDKGKWKFAAWQSARIE